MGLNKRTYVNGETVITAENLNDIQDAIIQIVPDDVKQALLQIASKVAYIDEHGQDYYDALEAALYPDASLVSISAVYTQSGTVYDSDSLDSLKADLVVTAHYDDSSTEVVTTYTLSGTLEVGTSTITVAYGGKTTTFSVTVTSWKNKMYYSSESGDIDRQNLATSWDSTHGLYVSAVTNNKRRTFTLPYGDRSYRYTSNNINYTDTSDYYPIPVPSSATSVTISITPATMYHGDSFYTLSNGEYTRQADPGWKQGSFTHTFTAGLYDYMAIACKKDSSGTVFTDEPEITVTFS